MIRIANPNSTSSELKRINEFTLLKNKKILLIFDIK
jgi:hypothetical protein